jgi:hypothetical protein
LWSILMHEAPVLVRNLSFEVKYFVQILIKIQEYQMNSHSNSLTFPIFKPRAFAEADWDGALDLS